MRRMLNILLATILLMSPRLTEVLGHTLGRLDSLCNKSPYVPSSTRYDRTLLVPGLVSKLISGSCHGGGRRKVLREFYGEIGLHGQPVWGRVRRHGRWQGRGSW